jgi:hypothetical protein
VAAPLAGQDVVYAFLSPAPMKQLWAKAQAEMTPGSLFVSNSFPVPGASRPRLSTWTAPATSALLLPDVEGMLRRKPEALALLVALISTLTVLAVFLTDLVLSRQRDIEAGERRLHHFGIMMAEHTARSFEAIDMLLREMASDLSLSRRDWPSWEAGKGWEYVAQRHSRAMPQLRDLAVFDQQGNQRFISTYFPPLPINVRDRPYFISLENGNESASFGPYIGRNSGRYTYAIARRITDAEGGFAGAAFASVEPAYLQDFCWSNRLSDDFEAVLINARGQVIGSCRPVDLSRQSPLLGAMAADVLFGGRLRDQIPQTGLSRATDCSYPSRLFPAFPICAFSRPFRKTPCSPAGAPDCLSWERSAHWSPSSCSSAP